MKPKTIVRLPDGREGTVVYHQLDGVGIKWGRDVDATEEEILRGDGPPPDAMLRDPYPSAEFECVGEEYEIVAGSEGDR